MTTQSITPKRLIRDSLISVIPIYKSLLIFLIPSLILSLSKLVIPKLLFSVIGELYYLSIGTIFYGAALFFSYKKLNQEDVTIFQSLQKALDKFPELLFFDIINFLLLPLILFPRLYFVCYLVIIKDLPIADAFKRCWQLTKSYGWKIFWNFLTLGLIRMALPFLSSLINASIFGVSVWDINRGELPTTHPAFVFDRLLTTAIYFFVYNPLLTIYVSLMFIRLLALEKINLGSVTM